MLHVDRDAPVAIDLGAVPRADTRFPYILFVSQSDTEAALGGYLGPRVPGLNDESSWLASERSPLAYFPVKN